MRRFPLILLLLLLVVPTGAQRVFISRPIGGARSLVNRFATVRGDTDQASGTESPIVSVGGGNAVISSADSATLTGGTGALTATLPDAETPQVSEAANNGSSVASSDAASASDGGASPGGSQAKPAASATINVGDELGDVAFCVPILEGSGNTLKEYVSGATSDSDANTGANWSTIDAGVAWSGPCIANTASAGASRGGAAYTPPAALTASGHVFHIPNNNLGAVTICELLQPFFSNTINQGAFDHLADMSSTGTALFGGYENEGTSPNFGGTMAYPGLKNSGGGSLTQITWPVSSSNPWCATIIEWGAGRGGGVTVYTTLDSSGNYGTTLRVAGSQPTADWQNSLSTIGPRINAIGPYGSGSPVGFRGKAGAYMLWERGFSSQERTDWVANPCRMLQ